MQLLQLALQIVNHDGRRDEGYILRVKVETSLCPSTQTSSFSEFI